MNRPWMYVLDERGDPVPEEDIVKWGLAFADTARRRVAQDKVAGVTVSTVFLGIDHNHSLKGPPILFETMVFREDGRFVLQFFEGQRRYATRAEALAGHEELVRVMRERIRAQIFEPLGNREQLAVTEETSAVEEEK